MAKPADIGSKRLISLAPNTWVQWVTESSAVTALEILDPEFQWVSRQNDTLIKAYSPEDGYFLIPNEIQLRHSDRMPQRLRAYAALAQEKYDLPVYPVLVNILAPPSTATICNCFEQTFRGLYAKQDFKTINLWEIDAEVVFQQSLRPLLPFVPVMSGGNNVQSLQRAFNLLQTDEDLTELSSLLGFFARFVLSSDTIQQILRWDMTVLRESPWYQEIKEDGMLDEGRSLIFKQLHRRVGELTPEMRTQILALSLPQIEDLGEALLDFSSLSDLTNWLQEHL